MTKSLGIGKRRAGRLADGAAVGDLSIIGLPGDRAANSAPTPSGSLFDAVLALWVFFLALLGTSGACPGFPLTSLHLSVLLELVPALLALFSLLFYPISKVILTQHIGAFELGDSAPCFPMVSSSSGPHPLLLPHHQIFRGILNDGLKYFGPHVLQTFEEQRSTRKPVDRSPFSEY